MVDEQVLDKAGSQAVDEDGFPVIDGTSESETAVEQEMQTKVDVNRPDGIGNTSKDRIYGVTLKQEERTRARGAELERISARVELDTQDGHEQHARAVAAQGGRECQRKFQQRTTSADPMVDPGRGDLRVKLTQGQLAAVNKQLMQLAKKLDGWSWAAIGRRPGEAVIDGKDLMSATVGVFEELRVASRQMVPVGKLEDTDRKEVSTEGTVTVFWEPSSVAISQVGLIEDDSGKAKFTSWKALDAPWTEEGEHVRVHGTTKNWYDGRISVVVTGWSTLYFPERGRWWE